MSNNIPWEYIKLSQVMASVTSDLSLYDDASLIDEDRIVKIIAECNEKLGERIYQSKACRIIVKDYIGPVPSDLWKIENMFATSTVTSPYIETEGGIVFGATQAVYTLGTPPKMLSGDRLIPVKTQCTTCGDGYYISTIERNYIEKTYKHIYPLILSETVNSACADYAPCTRWRGEYQVDMGDGEFKFSFKDGEVFVAYLGDMVDEEGEIVIPFHPRLNQYYEFAIKEKILEDIYLNSEADVAQKLQYVSQKKSAAYYDAWTYIQTAKAGQWTKMKKKAQMDYYNKWFRAFA